MNGFVYILKSKTDGRYYVGSSTNVERRLEQHRSGHTYTTKRYRNVELVFTQKFESIEKARRIERKIKSWKRKDYIEKIIKDGIIKTA